MKNYDAEIEDVSKLPLSKEAFKCKMRMSL